MKTHTIIFSAAFFLFNVHLLFAKKDSTSLIKPFGMGLHIEQFRLNDVSDFDVASANKIIFTISPVHSFRVEPEFGFKFGKGETNDYKNSSIYLGLGAFGMCQHKKLNIYGGLRFEYALVKSKYNGSPITYITDRISAGPAMGCEYFLGDNFTLGGEFALKYAALKNRQDPPPFQTPVTTGNYFTTDTGLFIRFYF